MKSYGLDFGTTNSLVATASGSQAKTLPVEVDGSSILRSTIYVHKDMNPLVGQNAINAYLEDVARGEPLKLEFVNTGKYVEVTKPFGVSGYKGEEMVPQILEVEAGNRGRLLQGIKSLLANNIYEGTEIFGNYYTLEDLLRIVISELKIRSDAVMDYEVDSVVFGRPVKYVGKDEELAMKRLTKVAKDIGFKNVEFEMEPIAAALSYGVDIEKKQNILVFDFGGGTLDISITQTKTNKVLGVDGVALGGDLLNSIVFLNKLYKHFGKEVLLGPKKLTMPNFIENALKNWYSISLLKTKPFIHSLENIRFLADRKEPIDALRDLIIYNLGFILYEEIDRAKIELSSRDRSFIEFKRQSVDLFEDISRTDFEDMIVEHIESAKAVVDGALDKASLTEDDIDLVLTTGGSSMIPIFKKMLVNKFGESKVKEIDVFESVAKGLALRAEQIFK